MFLRQIFNQRIFIAQQNLFIESLLWPDIQLKNLPFTVLSKHHRVLMYDMGVAYWDCVLVWCCNKKIDKTLEVNTFEKKQEKNTNIQTTETQFVVSVLSRETAAQPGHFKLNLFPISLYYQICRLKPVRYLWSILNLHNVKALLI